jgi:MFS transporter, ACS family, solute carrier family 17 (sodium-dependent inorganic phosphate cotransporter), member 5
MLISILQNGILSALPYLAMYVMTFPLGFMSDYALSKKWLNVTTARKISNTIGKLENKN